LGWWPGNDRYGQDPTGGPTAAAAIRSNYDDYTADSRPRQHRLALPPSGAIGQSGEDFSPSVKNFLDGGGKWEYFIHACVLSMSLSAGAADDK
jgi:hypothetical protein